jgi:flagellar protein FlgJ
MHIQSPLHTAAAQDEDAVQRARVTQAAEQFEGLFIHQMLQQMRKSAEQLGGEDRLFKASSDDALVGFADRMLADSLASQRAFGVADAIVRQLLPPAPLKSEASVAALQQQTQGNPSALPLDAERKPSP